MVQQRTSDGGVSAMSGAGGMAADQGRQMNAVNSVDGMGENAGRMRFSSRGNQTMVGGMPLYQPQSQQSLQQQRQQGGSNHLQAHRHQVCNQQTMPQQSEGVQQSVSANSGRVHSRFGSRVNQPQPQPQHSQQQQSGVYIPIHYQHHHPYNQQAMPQQSDTNLLAAGAYAPINTVVAGVQQSVGANAGEVHSQSGSRVNQPQTQPQHSQQQQSSVYIPMQYQQQNAYNQQGANQVD